MRRRGGDEGRECVDEINIYYCKHIFIVPRPCDADNPPKKNISCSLGCSIVHVAGMISGTSPTTM